MKVFSRPRHILPLIILTQFLGTSTWFAGNAILPALQQQWAINEQALAPLTNSIQWGFIVGALLFAALAIADRISPRILFCICSTLCGLSSLLIAVSAQSLDQVLWLRFFSGMMLAGVYPVGMKIAASWYPQGLGRALGYFIGALVLGTATPHLLSSLPDVSWRQVMGIVGSAGLLAGIMILIWVPDGPALFKGAPFKLRALTVIVRCRPLRAAVGGYLGHCWELYAVWAIAPIWLITWSRQHEAALNPAFWTSIIIASGALGCVIAGGWSRRFGSRAVAEKMLVVSGGCCLASPLMMSAPIWMVLPFWFIWGFSVVADSAQLSALSAKNAPPEVVGSALTLINAFGYATTALAVELVAVLMGVIAVEWLAWCLLPGPLLGIWSLRGLKDKGRTDRSA
ncbi:MAG: MFS transporter [Desulfobulbaceae bacterium]|nr:MFS transporter [Desulfobulbaceae bacterium]